MDKGTAATETPMNVSLLGEINTIIDMIQGRLASVMIPARPTMGVPQEEASDLVNGLKQLRDRLVDLRERISV